MAAFFILYIVLLSQIQLCMTAKITDPPISKSDLLYTTVEFSCKGIGDGLVWAVANNALTDAVKQERNIIVTTSIMSDIWSSNLTIQALPTNNKIEIACIVHSFYLNFSNYMIAAKEVKLTVTGVSPVVNVQWHSGPSLLTWSPPSFYFNGSSNHTEFVYDILLNGLGIINTTNTSVYLNISNCAPFNVGITVYADQYVSQENNQIYFNSGNYIVDIVEHTVTFDQVTAAVNINLTNLVTFADYKCNNTIYVTGSAINNKDGKQMSYPSLEINSNKSKEIILKYNMTNLKQSSRYTIGIYVTDLITEARDNITISTYNVQDFNIDVNSNGLVTVKCVFMQGSINERCYLIFLDAAQGLRQHFIVNGFKETNLTLTESGNYSVEVYDIVNGIIYGLAIELPKLIEVTIISPSASSKVTPTNIIPTSSSNPSDILSGVIITIVLTICVVILMLLLCLYFCFKIKTQDQGDYGYTVGTNPEDKVNEQFQPIKFKRI